MTIASATTRVAFNCDGVTTVFPVPIQAYYNVDFVVTHTTAAGLETTFTLNSDYSLVSSGSLSPPAWTMTTLAGTAWPAGDTLQVILRPAQTQPTQLVQGQAFPTAAIQTALDRAVQMVLALQDQMNRCVKAPDADTNPLNFNLPSALARENTVLTFDGNGNVSLAQTLPSGSLSANSIGGFLYPTSAAETAAGATVALPYWPYGNALRYGANNLGVNAAATTAALNAGLNAAGRGNVGEFRMPAGTYATNADIIVPFGSQWLQGGSGPFAVNLVGDGKAQTIIAPTTGVTNVINVNSAGVAGTWKVAGTIRDLQINGGQTAGIVNGILLNQTEMGIIRDVVVRGVPGRGIYLNNTLVTRVSDSYITACGSAAYGQVELDATNFASGLSTNTTFDHVWIQGANANCPASLNVDRANNTLIQNCAFESGGIGVQVSSKAATVGCSQVDIINSDFEDTISSGTTITAYIACGQGLTGTVYVNGLNVQGCSGYLSGATVVSQALFLEQTQAFYAARNSWATTVGTTAFYNFFGTANIRAIIDNHPLCYNTIPWVVSNGVQVATATPLQRWDQNASPSPAVPGSKTFTSTANCTVYLQGTTLGQGGWVNQLYAANVGATTVAGITGGVQGMELTLYGDGFTTMSYGTSGGAVKWTSGGNQLLAAGSAYKLSFNGNTGAWAQM